MTLASKEKSHKPFVLLKKNVWNDKGIIFTLHEKLNTLCTSALHIILHMYISCIIRAFHNGSFFLDKKKNKDAFLK